MHATGTVAKGDKAVTVEAFAIASGPSIDGALVRVGVLIGEQPGVSVGTTAWSSSVKKPKAYPVAPIEATLPASNKRVPFVESDMEEGMKPPGKLLNRQTKSDVKASTHTRSPLQVKEYNEEPSGLKIAGIVGQSVARHKMRSSGIEYASVTAFKLFVA